MDEAATKEESLALAYERGVVCTDEAYLHPDPYPSRDAWCAARLTQTEARLALLDPDQPVVFVNHYPLVREPTLRVPIMTSACPGHGGWTDRAAQLTASAFADRRGWRVVLLRLAYLAVTNGFAMLRLLPMSQRAKEVEILSLRHQITVLERQLHGQGRKVRFAPADRAFPVGPAPPASP